MRTVLKSKIHRARVTRADLHYEGSITIDTDLMDAADILPFEQVHVLDVDNGSRLTTYAIEGAREKLERQLAVGKGQACEDDVGRLRPAPAARQVTNESQQRIGAGRDGGPGSLGSLRRSDLLGHNCAQGQTAARRWRGNAGPAGRFRRLAPSTRVVLARIPAECPHLHGRVDLAASK